MNLFIDAVRQQQPPASDRWRGRERVPIQDEDARSFRDASVPETDDGGRSAARVVPDDRCEDTEHEVSQEFYRDEIAFDRRRTCRRRRRGVLRALAVLVMIPVVLMAAFLVSYVLTCIAGGATPDEVVELLGGLWERVRGAAYELARQLAGVG